MYYNSVQYAFRVWLTSALAIPNVYLLYYVATSGQAAYFPVNEYAELLLETLLASIPIGLVFTIVLDMMRNTRWTVKTKKIVSLTILQTLLLLAFTIIIHGVGDKRISWESCFDYVVISSTTIAVCIYLYKLKPDNTPGKRLSF